MLAVVNSYPRYVLYVKRPGQVAFYYANTSVKLAPCTQPINNMQ